jgi:hypothetical protein
VIFTVVWSPFALDRLAELWLRAADRNAVTAAGHRIDQLLRVDPHTRGVPFFGDRVIHVPPLRAAFSVNRMDTIVDVFDVW